MEIVTLQGVSLEEVTKEDEESEEGLPDVSRRGSIHRSDRGAILLLFVTTHILHDHSLRKLYKPIELYRAVIAFDHAPSQYNVILYLYDVYA